MSTRLLETCRESKQIYIKGIVRQVGYLLELEGWHLLHNKALQLECYAVVMSASSAVPPRGSRSIYSFYSSVQQTLFRFRDKKFSFLL
jgi:hypothetical protein